MELTKSSPRLAPVKHNPPTIKAGGRTNKGKFRGGRGKGGNGTNGLGGGSDGERWGHREAMVCLLSSPSPLLTQHNNVLQKL